MKNKVIILVGPSGVGKGSIEKELFKDPSLKLILSCSMTTRKPREQEIEGKHYFFVDEKTFLQKIENKEFIEWNKHFNNYYGTLKSEIDKILLEKNNPILEIETNGAMNVIEFYKQNNQLDNLISIFIKPPSLNELKQRIQNRGTETQEQIDQRLIKAEEEFKLEGIFDYSVINDTVENAVEKIAKIIKLHIN